MEHSSDEPVKKNSIESAERGVKSKVDQAILKAAEISGYEGNIVPFSHKVGENWEIELQGKNYSFEQTQEGIFVSYLSTEEGVIKSHPLPTMFLEPNGRGIYRQNIGEGISLVMMTFATSSDHQTGVILSVPTQEADLYKGNILADLKTTLTLEESCRHYTENIRVLRSISRVSCELWKEFLLSYEPDEDIKMYKKILDETFATLVAMPLYYMGSAVAGSYRTLFVERTKSIMNSAVNEPGEKGELANTALYALQLIHDITPPLGFSFSYAGFVSEEFNPTEVSIEAEDHPKKEKVPDIEEIMSLMENISTNLNSNEVIGYEDELLNAIENINSLAFTEARLDYFESVFKPVSTALNILSKKGINTELDYSSVKHLPKVIFSLYPLLRAVMNLVNNAGKFTPEGGTISIKTETSIRRVLITVRNTGPGINPDMFKRMFIIGESTGSTGLGLENARKGVEYNNGKFWAETVTLENGKLVKRVTDPSGKISRKRVKKGETTGTKFYISIPLKMTRSLAKYFWKNRKDFLKKFPVIHTK